MMRTLLSLSLLILVIFSICQSGHSLGEVIKKTAATIKDVKCKVLKTVDDMSEKALGELISTTCKATGDLAKLAAQGFGIVKCEEKKCDYCKSVGDGHNIYDLLCCLIEENLKEVVKNTIGCLKTPLCPDKKDKAPEITCHKEYLAQICRFKDAIDMAMKKKGEDSSVFDKMCESV